MTMTNAEWMIKHGYKFSDISAYGEYDNDCNFIWHIRLSKADIEEISAEHDYANVITAWLDAEHKEPILDDAEREYLSAVIRPFRDDVKFIVKYKGCFSSMAYEEIAVWYRNKMRGDVYHSFILPSFEKGTMYKGVEVNRHYTLEELGL